MRSAKARDLTTVAVFSDADAGSPHVAAADLAVRLPGVSATETYLNEAAIIAAAVATGADAIHPGYGFLAERASFARACQAAQITFVGPSPDVIATMGSKVDAKALMAANQVPVLPGALVDPAASDADIIASADVIGTPLLVKASFGGGGRGMRIVRDLRELPDAVRSAAREADAAFGDPTVFIERLVEHPRHLEVQIVGDAHGSVAHLFERECSVQRRHQKIIEEAPAVGI
ncbi:MAG: biotin carboxylase N-terminal domain-containing protein, partial [Actinomycetes bacterium]